MARTMKQRAVLAGLSGGAGLSMPAAAYAVELPFDLSSGGASLVAGAVLPFAVGALAGVAVTGTVAYFSLRAQEREFESHAVYVGAGFEAVPAGDRGSVREDAQPRRQKHGFFAKRAEDDVPVIARAEGALSEEEAWAEIDAALSENPAISCDPVNSKDLYQLALEELAAQASARASAQADAGDAAAHLLTVWSDFLRVVDAAYASELWALDYVDAFLESGDWKDLEKARAACIASARYLTELSMKEEDVSQEEYLALAKAGIDAEYQSTEILSAPELVEEAHRSVRDNRLVKLEQSVFDRTSIRMMKEEGAVRREYISCMTIGEACFWCRGCPSPAPGGCVRRRRW